MFCKSHFVKAFMDAFMAQSANPDACVKCAFVNILAKICAAMNFTRNQVVEGQIDDPIA
tara:strand:- start:54 stop:230 length:177 start_codon:yes stop_codon:yes gene_type:complete